MTQTGGGSLSAVLPALDRGGECPRLVANRDWAATPLGPLTDWSPGLLTSVGTCLSSRFGMLLMWGPDLIQVYNDEFRPILGADKHPAAMGAPASETWPEVWDTVGPMLHGVRGTGEAVWFDDLMLQIERSGYPEECHFHFTYSPVWEDGCVAGVLCVVSETTGQVVNARRLAAVGRLAQLTAPSRTSAAVVAATAEALGEAPDDVPFAALYLCGPDGQSATCVATTGSAPAALSVPPEGLSIAPAGEPSAGAPRVTGADLPRAVSGLLAGGERTAVLTGETGGSGADAADRPIAVATRLSDPGGATIAVLLLGINPHRPLDDGHRSFLDLLAGHVETALVRAAAAEAERARLEALAELDRVKTEFLANVSHEFRTPLTLLRGPLGEMLDDTAEPLGPGQRRRVEMAAANTERLIALVDSLLDFSRLEAGRLTARFEPTDLAALTADAAGAFDEILRAAGLALDVDCPALDEPAWVDPGLWEKIVFNLMSNAYKFTPRGRVTMGLSRQRDDFVLTVSDTGIGIPSGEQNRIFERFHRLEPAAARSHEGSGIGLALVRELAELHGGRVAVSSRPGEGSTFTVAIPVGRAHLPAQRVADIPAGRRPRPAAPYVAPVETGAPVATGSGSLVLVVDDNADMRRYLSDLLRPHWRVRLAGNATEALEAARPSDRTWSSAT